MNRKEIWLIDSKVKYLHSVLYSATLAGFGAIASGGVKIGM